MAGQLEPGGSRAGSARRGVFVVLPALVSRATGGTDAGARGAAAGLPPAASGAPGVDLARLLAGPALGAGVVVFSELPPAGSPALAGTAFVFVAAFAARFPGREAGACVALPRTLPGVLRLAEEAATAAGLLDGRLDLVLCEGPEEGAGGLPAEEALQLLGRALSGESIATGGGAVAVHPRPAANGRPRLWLLAGDPARTRVPGVGHLAPAPPTAVEPPAGELLLRVVDSPLAGGPERWLVGLRPAVGPAAGRRV